MARKAAEEIDTKHLFKRGDIWWIQAMRNGVKFVKTTRTSVHKDALTIRNRELHPMALQDDRDVTENLLGKMAGVDERLAKIEKSKASLLMAEAVQAYRESPNRPDSGSRTMDGYESQFKRFITWMNKKYPDIQELRHVTRDIAFKFAGALGTELTATSFNKYIVLLRRMWKVLSIHPDARLEGNPWADIHSKLQATHSRRELTVDELSKVITSLTGEMRTLFAIGIYCGLRLGDAATLKWGNVDLTRRIIMLVPSKTSRRSNGKQVQIPLHNVLFSILMEVPHTKRNNYVMPGIAKLYQRKGTRGADLSKRIHKVFEDCKITTRCTVDGYSRQGVDVGFHSLRHSFVSLSANAGVPLAMVQALVGHSNPAMTRHYLHVDLASVKNAIASLPNVSGKEMIEEKSDAKLEEIKKLLTGLTDKGLEDLRKATKLEISTRKKAKKSELIDVEEIAKSEKVS
jgi:integrase